MSKVMLPVILFVFLVAFGFSNTLAQDATEEADSIREKVKEKVEAARSNPKAYIGSVTDKTEDTLQIQNDLEEIQLISIDPESASFAKIDKKTTSAKYDDVAIGDYIIAMGFTNGNGVLETKRVIITSKPEKVTRNAVFGNILEINNKEVLLETQIGEFTLKFPKKWKGPEISEFEKDMTLVAVGEIDDKTITIRTVQLISKAPSEE